MPFFVLLEQRAVVARMTKRDQMRRQSLIWRAAQRGDVFAVSQQLSKAPRRVRDRLPCDEAAVEFEHCAREALSIAAANDHAGCVQALLQAGFHSNWDLSPALCRASASGAGAAVILALVHAKAGLVGRRQGPERLLGASTNALFCAAYCGQGGTAKVLIACKADATPLLLCDDGVLDGRWYALSAHRETSFLYAAVASGWTRGVPLLLAAKANLCVKDRFGQTVLHCAARACNTRLVLALLGRTRSQTRTRPHRIRSQTRSQTEADEAALHLGDKNGNTALHCAGLNWFSAPTWRLHRPELISRSQHVWPSEHVSRCAIVKALLGAKSNPQLGNNVGDTPLHIMADNYTFSSTSSMIPTVRALLEAKANACAANAAQDTVLHTASRSVMLNAKLQYNQEYVRALLDAGANAFAVNAEGDAPLHAAARCCQRRWAKRWQKRAAKKAAKEAAEKAATPAPPVEVEVEAGAEVETGAEVEAEQHIPDKWKSFMEHMFRTNAFVQCIVAAKVDLEARNRGGQTPIDVLLQ